MIEDFLIGHYTDEKNKTGCTVIISNDGATGGVSVRGGAPGTRETDLLEGYKLVDKINAVVLSGGSAFGLNACDGVMKVLSESKIGQKVGNFYVPIVCGAVIFDLQYGKPSYPNSYSGEFASRNADVVFETGNVGAGTGATVGKIGNGINFDKGGLGYAEMKSGELIIGCIVVTNAIGDIVEDGKIIAGANIAGKFINTRETMLRMENCELTAGGNTTIACLITNANITKAQAKRLSEIAHDGFALSISPVHTIFDGDTIFTMASNKVDCDFNKLALMAVEVTKHAVINSVTKD